MLKLDLSKIDKNPQILIRRGKTQRNPKLSLPLNFDPADVKEQLTPRKSRRPPKHIRQRNSEERLQQNKSVKKKCQIGTYEKAPHFMKFNANIRTGYRINFDSYWKLTKSLFMIHNETVNVWTHLLGMIFFFYLIGHTFNRYEPSEFYYSTVVNNHNMKRSINDYGVPLTKYDELLRNSTNMTKDIQTLMPSSLLNELFNINISDDINGHQQTSSFDGVSYYENFLNYVLSSQKLEEVMKSIEEKKGNIYMFWQSKKAIHAHKLETLELYTQHAIDQLRNIKKEYQPDLKRIRNCKECMTQFIEMIEMIPQHVQDQVGNVIERISHENFRHNLTAPQYAEIKLEKMKRLIEFMKVSIQDWKQQMKDKIDQPEFDWLDISPIIPEEGIYIHYTPRWPLILHYSCALLCFGFSSFYHLYNAHSKQIMNFFIRFDYAGICLMIAGSGTPPIYYSFACDQLQEWRWFYLALLYGLSTITMIIMMLPYFDQDHFHAFRSVLFTLTGLVNLFPVAHICYMVDPQYLDHFYVTTWLIGGMSYIVGAIFYGYQFPECKYKKTFDIIGSSHQIMHMGVVVAALLHYYGSIQVFHDRQLYGCPLPKDLF